ncbi:very-short-patch-repair endonuclease [Pseudonocardia sediminis]|uniref:Very-short-patch-repair endonuclease n=1 Tax=Pseudonocardia sediminis TaxID=1397368 RepID=A0A4Q7V2A2_PSEST|nr:type IV toxin-antitoxin system AbiEi family antitoxin domain-containing protein [Pseudonocardia sediminis]RZT86753.1 very-short-patch-repair endonuclease [Pseudonocardia sediminis]
MSLEELLLAQAGVLTRTQALAHGVAARTITRRGSSGAWSSIHPGVYLVGGHRFTDEARVRAAWLWGGGRSTVSGPSAAFWHGVLGRRGFRIDLTMPRASHRRRPPGVFLRRRDLEPEERGVVVTGRALSVLETAPVVANGAQFLDRALQRHISFTELHEAYCRAAGSRGMGPAGVMLVACADRADSAAERLMLRLLTGAGFSGFERAHPFGPFTVDVAFPASRVAIEVDGWAWHVDSERFATDRRKGNALVGAGWTVLRFTWANLAEEPGEIVRTVRAALAHATAA